MSTATTTKEERRAAWLVLIGIALWLPLAAWSGFAISKVWSWFVVPLGVPRLSVWAAAGIALLVKCLTIDTRKPPEDDTPGIEKYAYNLGVSVLLPGVLLLFGAVYHALAV